MNNVFAHIHMSNGDIKTIEVRLWVCVKTKHLNLNKRHTYAIKSERHH